LKITAQEENGLRCILQLARQEGGAPMMVRDIAEREGLSVAYVEKLLWILSRGGITESVRGPKGGYRLLRPCVQISIGEVMRVLGGIPSKDEICSQFTGQHDTCVHHGDCGLRPVWASITDFVHSVFDKIPLSVLLQGEIDVKMVQMSGRPQTIGQTIGETKTPLPLAG
jgi:Rrf2 family protein